MSEVTKPEAPVKADKVDASKDEEKKVDEAAPLATIGEVFSFVESGTTTLYIVLGFLAAVIAGLALPASLVLFADVLGDVSAISEEGIDPVIDVVYTMMVLGVVSLFSESLFSKFFAKSHVYQQSTRPSPPLVCFSWILGDCGK